MRFCHHQSSDFRVTLILFSGFFLFVFFLLVGLWGAVSYFFFKDRYFYSPFECGFDSQGVGRSFFSVRFSYFVLLFLCFDVELVWFFGFPLFSEFSFFLFPFLFGFVVFGFVVEERLMLWEFYKLIWGTFGLFIEGLKLVV
ncbi:MAG: NADH-ubiquinone oxidoreductase chain 3 [Ignavibacteria bacterium]|nr:MAG: NADH-ubiquinone oxidoreductase chain 3 [Ignavibacteria bacterium]